MLWLLLIATSHTMPCTLHIIFPGSMCEIKMSLLLSEHLVGKDTAMFFCRRLGVL